MIGILIDVTRCNGCGQCVEACTEINHLGPETPWPQRRTDGLSAERWTALMPATGGRYARKLCRHCLYPACVSVCPAKAMIKTPEGPVIYDASKCLGCRYCMMACPYGIPRYEWSGAAPVVSKCQLCYDRIKAGEPPACVAACPQRAALFGERADLLAEAHRRLAAEPGLYVQKVYGEDEVGGTSVLYISDVPLDLLSDFGDLGSQPLPGLTHAALNAVPPVAAGLTVALAGFSWVIRRRMRHVNHTELPVELPSDRQ